MSQDNDLSSYLSQRKAGYVEIIERLKTLPPQPNDNEVIFITMFTSTQRPTMIKEFINRCFRECVPYNIKSVRLTLPVHNVGNDTYEKFATDKIVLDDFGFPSRLADAIVHRVTLKNPTDEIKKLQDKYNLFYIEYMSYMNHATASGLMIFNHEMPEILKRASLYVRVPETHLASSPEEDYTELEKFGDYCFENSIVYRMISYDQLPDSIKKWMPTFDNEANYYEFNNAENATAAALYLK